MDYEGQRLAELLFYYIILGCGFVGWIIGYFKQDFMPVFQCWLVGVVISVVVSVFGPRSSIVIVKMYPSHQFVSDSVLVLLYE